MEGEHFLQMSCFFGRWTAPPSANQAKITSSFSRFARHHFWFICLKYNCICGWGTFVNIRFCHLIEAFSSRGLAPAVSIEDRSLNSPAAIELLLRSVPLNRKCLSFSPRFFCLHFFLDSSFYLLFRWLFNKLLTATPSFFDRIKENK